jgi:hypothetical protein
MGRVVCSLTLLNVSYALSMRNIRTRHQEGGSDSGPDPLVWVTWDLVKNRDVWPFAESGGASWNSVLFSKPRWLLKLHKYESHYSRSGQLEAEAG